MNKEELRRKAKKQVSTNHLGYKAHDEYGVQQYEAGYLQALQDVWKAQEEKYTNGNAKPLFDLMLLGQSAV